MKKSSVLLVAALMGFPLMAGGGAADAAGGTGVANPNINQDILMLDDYVETNATDDGLLEGEVDELVVSEPIEETEEDGLVGVEGTSLTEMYGRKIPTSRHNIGKKHCNIQGTAYNYGILYSNKLFYGSKKYVVSLTNRGKYTATVQFKTRKGTAKTLTIKKNKRVTVKVYVKNANTNYYLRLSGREYKITGYVSK